MTRRRWLLAAAALAVAVPLALLAAILAFGMTIDASPWREALARRASAALGRQVVLEGPLQLTLARSTALHIGGVRVLSPPGVSATDFATLGAARAQIDLFAALRGQLVVRGLEATDARIRLERSADDRTNWSFRTSEADAPSTRTEPRQIAIDIDEVTLRRIDVEYVDAGRRLRYALALDELRATGGWDDRLAIVAHGRTARSLPFVVAFAGGSMRDLVEGTAAWPCTAALELAGTRVHAAGELMPSERKLRLEFGAGTDSLEEVEQLLGARLPDFGVAALSGRVVGQPGSVELSGLHGMLGESQFEGNVVVTLSDAAPRATGDITMASLDLRPFLRGSARDTRRPLTYEDLANSAIPLRNLVPIPVAITVRVDRLVGVDLDVRDATLRLTSDERGLRAPLAATVAGMPFDGRVEVDTSGTAPSVAIELGARGARLGELALLIAGIEGIDGVLARAELRAAGRGETLGEAVRDIEARLDVTGARLSYGNLPGARPIGVSLDSLVVDTPRGRRLRGSARGALLGKPASFTFRGPELTGILGEEPFSIELDVLARGVKARIAASAANPSSGRPAAVAFRVDAQRSGDLAEWLGVARASHLPVALRGEARFPQDGWALRDMRLKVGRSDLSGELRRSTAGARPLTVANLASATLDLPELAMLRAPESGTNQPQRGTLLELPILPQGIDLADADVDLRLERVALQHTEAREVRFKASTRDGRLPPSPFAATIAGVPFAGTLGLDLRTALPEAAIALQASDADVGGLLRVLRLAEDIDAHAEALQVTLSGRGARLGEFLENASFQARVSRGEVALRGRASRIVARMQLDEGLVRAAPGQPIDAHLVGHLDDTPIELDVTSARLFEVLRGATRVPLRAVARAAGTTLTLAGETDLPLGRGARLTLEAAGDRLDSLSGLARVELPPWGPWSLSGPIAMTPTGYAIERFELRLGESRLNGSGTLDIAGARPRLDLRVEAPRIQLDDFPWERAPAPPGALTVDSLRGSASGVATRTQRLLGAQVLGQFDAYVDIEARQVLSGRDTLGDGALRLRLTDGHLQVGPAVANLPGGSAGLSGDYDPSKGTVRLAVGVHGDNFEYGVLARRGQPDADAAGRFSLSLALTSSADSLNAILASASGMIDLVAWPRNVGVRQVDFWVVNLLRTLLPFFARGEPSVVNCVVGRFNLVDGTLHDEVFILDTTRVRVFGAGSIDFATKAVDLRFHPRVKGLGLGAIEPPIRVTGTLSDFRVGVTPGDFFAAAKRFFTSLVVVPLQTLFRGPIPADGRDICGVAPGAPADRRP